MRFKHFIVESDLIVDRRPKGEGDFSVRRQSDADWVSWVRKNCKAYLHHAGAHPIYRGFDNVFESISLATKDTNEFTRRSANTANYYTLWVDNAPAWKNFPKRAKSYISTVDHFIADAFGHTFQLFPADTAKIGICPTFDFWDAFPDVPGSDLGNFARLLAQAFAQLYSMATAKRAMVDWDVLRDLLERTSLEDFVSAAFKHKYEQKLQLKKMKDFGSNLINFFEQRLIPGPPGFKVVTGRSFAVPGLDENEVWVQGEVALLNIEKIDNAGFPETVSLLKEFKIVLP